MNLWVLSLVIVGWLSIGEGKQASLEADFQSIKEVLKNDNEKKKSQAAFEKKKEPKKISPKSPKKIAKKISPKSRSRYGYPNKDIFWNLFTDLWLVRNVHRLKWDFKKPDYGLDVAFTDLLEEFGFLEKKFKILLLNDFSLTHMALPSKSSETVFLLSLPFIRTMDLTKREISVLLLEDYIRFQMGYLVNYIKSDDLNQWIGKTVSQKIDRTPLNKALRRADDFIFKKGFNFQQQFEVTQRMTSLLRSRQKYWDAYLSLLKKIDKLIKSDQLYRTYTQIYPAPEIQLNWVLPEKKVL